MALSNAIIFMVLSWLTMTIIDSTQGQRCTQGAIDKCEEGFEKYVTNGNYAGYTRQELIGLCDEYDIFDDCIKPFERKCEQITRLQLEGLDLSYGYMCGEGFEVRAKNSDCYEKDAIQRESESCVNNYKNAQSGKDYVDCRAVEKMFGCMNNTFARNCNDEVAHVQTTMERRALKPLLIEVGCDATAIRPWYAVYMAMAALVVTLAYM